MEPMHDDFLQNHGYPRRNDTGKAPMRFVSEIQPAALEICLADMPCTSSQSYISSPSGASCSRNSTASNYSHSNGDSCDSSRSATSSELDGERRHHEFLDLGFALDNDEQNIDINLNDLSYDRQMAAWNEATRPADQPKLDVIEEEWPFDFVVDGMRSLFNRSLGKTKLAQKLSKLKDDSKTLYQNTIKPTVQAMRQNGRQTAGAAVYKQSRPAQSLPK